MARTGAEAAIQPHASQTLIARDSGIPRVVILLMMVTPIIASLFCLSNVRARRRSPTICLKVTHQRSPEAGVWVPV